MISNRRKLWLFVATNCMKFTNPKDSKQHATMVVDSLQNDEEVEFVREILNEFKNDNWRYIGPKAETP